MGLLRVFLYGVVAVSACGSVAASICGDGSIDPGETCDPPGAAACDCCETRPTPGCNDSSCEDSVCWIDPLCCVFGWDEVCVQQALTLPECTSCCADCRTDCTYCGDGLVNGAPGEEEECDPLNPPGCDCCVPGSPPGCSDPSCEASVCAVDPFCCETTWDLICTNEAAEFLSCLSCCPRSRCNEACRADEDGDGIPDTDDPCVFAPNPESGSAVFGQPVFAVQGGDTFEWPHDLPYICAQGEFSTTFDVAGYVVQSILPGSGRVFHDPTQPQPGTALWYLWKPDCSDATWGSSGPSEIVCSAPGDCCETHGTSGCGQQSCKAAVCALLPACCVGPWDGECVDLALSLQGCINGCDGTLCRDASLP